MTKTGLENTSKRVVVGLTGRLASSIAAFLLKKQGFSVIGVAIHTSNEHDFPSADSAPKCHIQNIEQIKKFCKSLNIPLHLVDARDEYNYSIFDPLIERKLTGLANVSCFDCTTLRIRVLFDKMLELKADNISTGHFAKIQKNFSANDFTIHTSNDAKNDQSMLLAGLDKKYLEHLILPLGELGLNEVTKIAQKFKLGIPENVNNNFCFQKPVSYIERATKLIPKSLIKKGEAINIDSKSVYGEHEGFFHYHATQSKLNFDRSNPGQERNFEVVGFDLGKGKLLLGDKEHLSFAGFQLGEVTLADKVNKAKPFRCFFKSKSFDDFKSCVATYKNNNSVLLELEEDLYPIILGERVVLYDRAGRNARILGTGTVYERGSLDLVDRASDYRGGEEKDLFIGKSLKF